MKRTLLCAALAAITLPCYAADLTSAVSRRVHGAAGIFDIPLVANEGYTVPAGTIEHRVGPYHQVVFIWDRPIASAECQGVSAGPSVGVAVINGNEVTCPLYVPFNGLWTLINVVVQAEDGTWGEALTQVGYLYGDVDGSGAVTVADQARVRQQVAQPVTAANFRMDVNASGAITVSDAAIVQSKIATGLPTD